MPHTSRSPEPSMLKEYESVLKRCTYKVACQNRCDLDDTKPCSCLEHIVHVDDLMQWWHEKIPGGSGQTKLTRLAAELPDPKHRPFPFYSANNLEILNGDQSYLTVLSILLAINRANLIDIFYDSGMTHHLDIVRDDNNGRLRENLRKKIDPQEVDVILRDFHKERWAFCPLKLSLNMDHHLQGSKVIPPFCHKVPLSSKGATASIYWVAVQENLVSDESLKRTINDSLYQDPTYGKCYQMVLKTYCGNKRSFFDLEKAAFEGLANDNGVPIVRYLGCYTHDYGDGEALAATYNILLEYAEWDLYQAWADETNVPPVRAEEIIRIWASYFDVAKAIRHLHNFALARPGSNTPLEYIGWHADIKPDNILLFRGRLKLADFGMSRFSQVARRQGGSVPTELIDGFTITYGAPEVSRMKQPDGTMTGVTQSIDTWSFGCVLSVAATWLVLGFQGVRVFEQLRQQASRDKHDPFHDGFDVLPHIRRWHNFLRGVLRPSDTATSLVLDLIENNMLQKDPANRMGLEQLCTRLQDILERATALLEKLPLYSRTTEPDVREAMLAIERRAQTEKASKRSSTTTHVVDVNALNPLQRATMQITRGDIVRSKPLGQTPYRREMLEHEQRANAFIQDDNEKNTKAAHNGGWANSPTASFSSGDVLDVTPLKPRKQKPRNPNQGPVAFPGDVTAPYEPASKSSHSMNADARDRMVSQTMFGRSILGSGHQSQSAPTQAMYNQNRHMPTDDGSPNPTPHGDMVFPTSFSTTSRPELSIETSRTSDNAVRRPYVVPSIVAPGTPVEFDEQATAGAYHQHVSHDATPTSSGLSPTVNGMDRYRSAYATQQPVESPQRQVRGQWYQDPSSQIAPAHPDRHSSYLGHATHDQHPSSGPSELAAPMTPPERYSFSKGNDETQPMTASKSLRREPPPQSVDELPYDICQVRTELDHHTPKGKRALVKSLFGKEERPTDQVLAETYGNRRDIVFVIDNSATMLEHWPIVVFVAETLVMKAAGLDKDGVDLIFTVDGGEHNKSRLKADAGRKAFRTALNRAAPENTNRKDCQTDMHETLDDIHQKWKRNGQPPTTLLILTDGVWGNTMDNLVDNTIIDIAGTLFKQKAGLRPFSIQFIRFGDRCVDKLERLDNQLCNDRGLKDIVDHCSWRSTVDKMLKGSISAYEDGNDPEETPIIYEHRALVALFQAFNNDVLQDRVTSPSSLGPPSVLRRSVSRSSSRNSTIEAPKRKHDSAPSPQPGSGSWQHGHHRSPMSG